ncbi:MAG: IS110 family transposase [Sulfitobacter sp.]|nr:IS110 family transposase [Sulfitobacter sp.]
MARNRGVSISANDIKRLDFEKVSRLLANEALMLAVASTLVVMRSQQEMIVLVEKVVRCHVKHSLDAEAFKHLCTVNGIGDILGLTILLETGDIGRFERVGDYASYCRCVDSKRITNGKNKGKGNRKNGNKYLAWAFVEAANFAVRFQPRIRRYYQRKCAQTKPVIATKTVAHKLARVCYFIPGDGVDFDVGRAFG